MLCISTDQVVIHFIKHVSIVILQTHIRVHSHTYFSKIRLGKFITLLTLKIVKILQDLNMYYTTKL